MDVKFSFSVSVLDSYHCWAGANVSGYKYDCRYHTGSIGPFWTDLNRYLLEAIECVCIPISYLTHACTDSSLMWKIAEDHFESGVAVIALSKTHT